MFVDEAVLAVALVPVLAVLATRVVKE